MHVKISTKSKLFYIFDCKLPGTQSTIIPLATRLFLDSTQFIFLLKVYMFVNSLQMVFEQFNSLPHSSLILLKLIQTTVKFQTNAHPGAHDYYKQPIIFLDSDY